MTIQIEAIQQDIDSSAYEAIQYVVPEGKDEEYAIAEVAGFAGAERVQYSELHQAYRILGHLGFWFSVHPGDYVVRDQHGYFPVRANVFDRTFVEKGKAPAEPAKKARKPRKPAAAKQEQAVLDV